MKKPKGRPIVITPVKLARLKAAMVTLQVKAKGTREVTLAMIMRRARVTACERTIRDALHNAGVSFYKLYSKPELQEGDSEKRLAWAKARLNRSKSQWLLLPHTIIDNKGFQVFHNQKGRDFAARRQVRGIYRMAGDDPQDWNVKQRDVLKFPAATVQVTAGVVKGKSASGNTLTASGTHSPLLGCILGLCFRP